MNTDDSALVEAREALRHGSVAAGLTLLLASTTLTIVTSWGLSAVTNAQPYHSVITAGVVLVVMLPVVLKLRTKILLLTAGSDRIADDRQRRLDDEARRRDFDAQLADAFEMAETEYDALRVVERALTTVLPGQPSELLMADNSNSHMSIVASTASSAESIGCDVNAPNDCPASRRGRIHYFPDREAVNTCPKLAARPLGRVSALCVPVSISGRPVGVIHTIGEVDTELPDLVQTDLRAIASQAGSRLGMLRVMAETQIQATTDGLTGLLNRRAFENTCQRIRVTTPLAAVAMADLDHFKDLNDTYGHDTGDRALRTFAETLRHCLRSEDVLSRRGGEEFAMFFPGCESAAAVSGLNRVRAQLPLALAANGLPACTASFGVVAAALDEELDSMLIRADNALFAAKRAGRDCVIVHDMHGRARFESAAPRGHRRSGDPDPVVTPAPAVKGAAGVKLLNNTKEIPEPLTVPPLKVPPLKVPTLKVPAEAATARIVPAQSGLRQAAATETEPLPTPPLHPAKHSERRAVADREAVEAG